MVQDNLEGAIAVGLVKEGVGFLEGEVKMMRSVSTARDQAIGPVTAQNPVKSNHKRGVVIKDLKQTTDLLRICFIKSCLSLLLFSQKTLYFYSISESNSKAPYRLGTQ